MFIRLEKDVGNSTANPHMLFSTKKNSGCVTRSRETIAGTEESVEQRSFLTDGSLKHVCCFFVFIVNVRKCSLYKSVQYFFRRSLVLFESFKEIILQWVVSFLDRLCYSRYASVNRKHLNSSFPIRRPLRESRSWSGQLWLLKESNTAI